MFSKILKLDWILNLAASMLLGIGLLALYSISTAEEGQNIGFNIFQKQVIFAGIGVITMLAFSFINYHYFRARSTLVYFLMLTVLMLVLIWGAMVRGTTGWFSVGFFNLQPVELAKVMLILSLASFIVKSKAMLSEISRLVAITVITGATVLLVLKQPDFGSALVLIFIVAMMTIFSGISWRYLAGLCVIGLVTGIVGWFFLADYQKERLATFVNPNSDPRGSGYNVIQSMVAVGSGGVAGKGLGHGSQSQLNFLPENHTDFIYAVIAEEFGARGTGLVLLLFLIIFYRLKKIAEKAQDNFGYLIVVGVMSMFFVQIFINIGMNMGIMPVTGIPLILISYGGSSLVSVFIALGIVNNIYMMSNKNPQMKIEMDSI